MPSTMRLTGFSCRTQTAPSLFQDGSVRISNSPVIRSGEFEILTDPSWNSDGAICVRQENPVSLMVLGMTLDVAVGG